MEPCLASLDKQTCKDFRILVVDNASTDGSIEYMKEHYPDIRIIALDQNYGFSKAVNTDMLNQGGGAVHILVSIRNRADPPYLLLCQRLVYTQNIQKINTL